jgi:hypothetical protein
VSQESIHCAVGSKVPFMEYGAVAKLPRLVVLLCLENVGIPAMFCQHIE